MIAVFSGTGNSMYVGRRLAEELGEEVFEIVAGATLPADGGLRLIWIFPVYSWGVPPVVRRFIRESADVLSSYAAHFAVMTCGDDAGHTDRVWRDDLVKAGAKAVAAFSVIMPNTYVCMKGFDIDSAELAQAKIDAARSRIDEIASRIASGDSLWDITRGAFAWIKTAVIYPWFCRFEMSPKPFRPTAVCVGCGLCARTCPMENISMGADRLPHWADNCAMCLRCYHICPHHAVAYGKTTRGKGQYREMLPQVFAQKHDKIGQNGEKRH